MKSPSLPSGEHPSPLASSRSRILWLQVAGLAVVQGAILLAWVIYDAYLPFLLTRLGFPVVLGATILIVGKLLAVVMEPLMGGLSDQAQRWVGTRFPFISGGIVLSSALFILIPTIAIFGSRMSAIRWMLPVVLVAWTLAITVFRSPAISLLRQYARPAVLPLAASLLTVSNGLIGACQPFVNKLISGWGPAVTFAIGSFVLLGAGAVLRFVHPSQPPASSSQSSESSPLPSVNSLLPFLGLIFVTGAGVAWGSNFLVETLQKVVKNLSASNVDWVMFAIAIALALAAIPAGAIAVKLGNHRAMLYGIGATVGVMLLMALLPNLVTLGVGVMILVAAYSLIVNGAIPYALLLVPPQRAGLGVGMYFGGSAAAGGVFGMGFAQFDRMTAIAVAVLGAIAFLGAGLCIVASTKVKVRKPS